MEGRITSNVVFSSTIDNFSMVTPHREINENTSCENKNGDLFQKFLNLVFDVRKNRKKYNWIKKA